MSQPNDSHPDVPCGCGDDVPISWELTTDVVLPCGYLEEHAEVWVEIDGVRVKVSEDVRKEVIERMRG